MEDSLKRLEDACRDVARDIREIELKRDNLTNDIASLEAQKFNLSAEVDSFKEKAEAVRKAIVDEKRSQIMDIEENLRKSSDLKAGLELESAVLSQKQNEIDKLKYRLENLISENKRIEEDLAAKSQIIEAKLAEIESFKTKITNV